MQTKPPDIVPFANESDSTTIGDLTIENRTDRITIYGNTDITRDKEGLQRAMRLKKLIDDTIDILGREPLPDHISMVKPRKVPNPFAKAQQ